MQEVFRYGSVASISMADRVTSRQIGLTMNLSGLFCPAGGARIDLVRIQNMQEPAATSEPHRDSG